MSSPGAPPTADTFLVEPDLVARFARLHEENARQRRLFVRARLHTAVLVMKTEELLLSLQVTRCLMQEAQQPTMLLAGQSGPPPAGEG